MTIAPVLRIFTLEQIGLLIGIENNEYSEKELKIKYDGQSKGPCYQTMQEMIAAGDILLLYLALQTHNFDEWYEF